MNLDLSTIFKPTILLALALMAVIVMMILPMPAWVLDIGLAASFALAILMFTVTLFIERPLDFSVFPTVLLASLMLRLSLNVSSTKLIIGQGHTGTGAAGDVIEAPQRHGEVAVGVARAGALLLQGAPVDPAQQRAMGVRHREPHLAVQVIPVEGLAIFVVKHGARRPGSRGALVRL